jgi:hypothetical protein
MKNEILVFVAFAVVLCAIAAVLSCGDDDDDNDSREGDDTQQDDDSSGDDDTSWEDRCVTFVQSYYGSCSPIIIDADEETVLTQCSASNPNETLVCLVGCWDQHSNCTGWQDCVVMNCDLGDDDDTSGDDTSADDSSDDTTAA